MILKVMLGDQTLPVEVGTEIVFGARDFFERMEQDMGRGWQMSREYVEHPTTINCCQIAADKLFTAIHHNKQEMIRLMAGYILSRLPGVEAVMVDTSGDMLATEFVMKDGRTLGAELR